MASLVLSLLDLYDASTEHPLLSRFFFPSFASVLCMCVANFAVFILHRCCHLSAGPGARERQAEAPIQPRTLAVSYSRVTQAGPRCAHKFREGKKTDQYTRWFLCMRLCFPFVRQVRIWDIVCLFACLRACVQLCPSMLMPSSRIETSFVSWVDISCF
jgi:hypothetical protein